MTIKPPPPPPSPAPQHDDQGRFLPGHNLAVGNRGNPNGRPRKFEGPEELWQAFCAYRDWNEANPLQEEVHTFYKGVPKKTTLSKPRAMTWKGFAAHAGFSAAHSFEWKKREDLADVMDHINSIMFAQKFEGAAAGLFKEAIISRELGLADKREVSGANGGPVNFTIEPIKSGTFLPPED